MKKTETALRVAVLKLIQESARAGFGELTARQFYVLLRLPDRPTVRVLAAEIDVGRPIITRAMDRLEDLGFAERLPDPEDGRSILLGRTREGDEFVRRVESGFEVAPAA